MDLNTVEAILILSVILCVVLLVVESRKYKPKPPVEIRDSVQKYCTVCGSIGFPVFREEGSAGVELLLWLTFIVPGIIYSIWRGSTRRWACPMCGNSSM